VTGARGGVIESEIERVYRDDGARLWWAVLAFAHDRDVASDAVAEAFAQLLARGAAVRDPARWVWRAAFRIAAGELKRRHSAPFTEKRLSYEMTEPARDLIEALRQLSPKQRAAVVLHYLGGYPSADIASILGSTTAAVKVHLSQGRRRLRAILEDEDERPR
jgi:RNA polymerase sigma-70 factor, ECF subfamily